jgi:hypothetical protein
MANWQARSWRLLATALAQATRHLRDLDVVPVKIPPEPARARRPFFSLQFCCLQRPGATGEAAQIINPALKESRHVRKTDSRFSREPLCALRAILRVQSMCSLKSYCNAHGHNKTFAGTFRNVSISITVGRTPCPVARCCDACNVKQSRATIRTVPTISNALTFLKHAPQHMSI